MKEGKKTSRKAALAVVLLGAAVLGWLCLTAFSGAGLIFEPGSATVVLSVGILVFREGLECILVLAALTAGMTGPRKRQQQPVYAGVAVGFVATLITWRIAVGVISDLSQNLPALEVQAATGLLAVIVLLTVMNWFFHKIYWTGWISMHSKKKRDLLDSAENAGIASRRLVWGLGLLGFSSLYREGFEVVLFLQSYRLRIGGGPVLFGTLLGLGLASGVAVITFVAHRHLPYRKMLVLTGVLLGLVLLVMVGEQAQEMQLAGWLPTTTIPWLSALLPSWMGMWFSIFPNLETLVAQALAAVAVVGSYIVARKVVTTRSQSADFNDSKVSHLPSPN